MRPPMLSVVHRRPYLSNELRHDRMESKLEKMRFDSDYDKYSFIVSNTIGMPFLIFSVLA